MAKSRGKCGECRKMVALRLTGLVQNHREHQGTATCEGSGESPIRKSLNRFKDLMEAMEPERRTMIEREALNIVLDGYREQLTAYQLAFSNLKRSVDFACKSMPREAQGTEYGIFNMLVQSIQFEVISELDAQPTD